MAMRRLLGAALAVGLSLGCGGAFADDDPPDRVGRLSYVDGTASFRPDERSEWSPATLNYPVVEGESFWTEPQSRLELQIGAVEVRLDESTELSVVALDDRSTRLWLGQGVANLHLAAVPPGGVRVLTPRGEIELVAPGRYHIDVGGRDGDALRVTTLNGQAEMSGPRSRVEIQAGESAIVDGDPATVTLGEGRATEFDDWALRREERAVVRDAGRYVSPETSGYQDLDRHGSWDREPDYGAVWYPAVAPDWAPYRYGHWAWVRPWGWTWIDDAPWGFAPFHYGRWVEIRDRWAWCPGERAARPVYAPALVAFIGGDGFGVAIAAGPAQPAVGWVPLAPNEVYRPHYHASDDYVRNVNVNNVDRRQITTITNVTVVNNVTVNNYHNGAAATVVPAGAFTRAAPVQHAALSVPHEELAHARVNPDVGHLQPSAAARAGVAVPAAAGGVPQHAPASLAPAHVTPAALGPQPNEPAPPAAPGPHGRSHDERETHLPPATLKPTPTPPGPAAHLPPAGPSAPPPPSGSGVTTQTPPLPHHDAPPSHPAATAITPPPPPAHAPAVVATPPKPAPPPKDKDKEKDKKDEHKPQGN